MSLFAFGGAIAGAIVGSFIATLCIRWPRGEQATNGRSRCDSCNRTLQPYEMIPLVSAIIARGKCRTCGAPIPPYHVFIELICALLAGVALYLVPNSQGIALAAFWLLLVAPATLDWRHFWLPDRLLAALALAGLALGTLASGVPLVDRLIGGAVGYLSLSLIAVAYRRLRHREGLGQGDPKLLGAIGLWTGWAALPMILLVASVVGIFAALVLRRGRADAMPFGTLLAVGAIVSSGVAAAGALTF